MANLMRRGRLSSDADEEIVEYMSGIDIGNWMFSFNLDIDRAHLVMLVEQDIVSSKVADSIFKALDDIEEEGYNSLEQSVDTHVTTEQAIINRTSEDIGGRLHTARSRNDKFATWVRIFLRDEILELCKEVLDLRRALLDRADETSDWLLSGYTSLQRAQPTTLGHHLMAYENVFRRDFERLNDAYTRVNRNPLGSAALAGTGFDIDRHRTTQLLGFEAPVRNSMDGVATRDVAIESVSSVANLLTSLSRLCEELIRWSSREFGFVELDDSFTGTSSIMPQKKNPYSAEIARSKAATVIGDLTSLLSLVKGLPMAYNHDFQESTRLTIQAFESANSSVRTLTQVIETAEFDKQAMEQSVEGGFVCATELADTIVRNTEYSFRTAHHIVASIAKDFEDASVDIIRQVASDVTGHELNLSEQQIEEALDPRRNVKMRDSLGGPGEISEAIEDATVEYNTDTNSYEERRAQLEEAHNKLAEATRSVRNSSKTS